MGPIEILFLLGPLAIVPTGISLLPGKRPLPGWLAGAGALGAVLSFFFPQGWTAAACAAVWTVVCLGLSLEGFRWMMRTPMRQPGNLPMQVGLIYLAIGGGWFFLARLGWAPMEFADPLPLLTAVHFHYTAFAGPLLLGLAARRLREFPGYGWISFCILAGSPLMAAGFSSGSPLLRFLAASILALGFGGLSLTYPRLYPVLNHSRARNLLGLGSGCLFLGMILALFYAAGDLVGREWISIPAMAWSHGILNGICFSYLGLLAWKLEVGEKKSEN